MAVVLGTIEGTKTCQLKLLSTTLYPLNRKHPTLDAKDPLRTGVNVDSRVDCADFILNGLVCATAQVEPSVVLVLESSNRRDKRRSSDDGGLHLDFSNGNDSDFLLCLSAERVKRCLYKRVTRRGGR